MNQLIKVIIRTFMDKDGRKTSDKKCKGSVRIFIIIFSLSGIVEPPHLDTDIIVPEVLQEKLEILLKKIIGKRKWTRINIHRKGLC